MPLTEAAALLAIYCLAAGALMDAWNNGAILAGARARVEADAGRRPLLAQLAECAFCQAYHAPFWLLLLFWLPGLLVGAYLGPTAAEATQLVPLSLAATRLCTLAEGLLPADLRHGRRPPE